MCHQLETRTGSCAYFLCPFSPKASSYLISLFLIDFGYLYSFLWEIYSIFLCVHWILLFLSLSFSIKI
jgi:hypothetical protein